jgi:hypothetical protein
MVSTSLDKRNIHPAIVGAGPGSAAKGLGTRFGKRAASLSRPKPRISSNFDGHGRGSTRGFQNEPNTIAGAKSKKNRSAAKAANGGARASNVLGKAGLFAKLLPRCHWAKAEGRECLAGQPKAKLPPTCHLTASDKSDEEESITRKEKARGAQEDFINKQNPDGCQPRSSRGVQTKLDVAAGVTSVSNKPPTIGNKT